MALDFTQVHKDMLDSISNRYQKTAGFPAYDFTAAFALAVLSLDGDVSTAERHLDIDNLTGTELDTYVKQHRGLSRKYATYATATMTVVTGSGDILAGALFSTASGVEFYAVEDKTCAQGDTFQVRAYVAGESGNVGANEIVYMPITIAGIAAVTNAAAASGGYDAESDDEFRGRLYDDLQRPNNGSNQQAYIAMAMSVSGVGNAKCFPQAFGPNTLEICIVGATMEPADGALIQQVQTYIDPNENGDGAGEAAMGAACTVTTATSLAINVTASVTLAEGYTMTSAAAAVRAVLTSYIRDVAFDRDTTYISYAQISNRISGADGILDHTGLKLNGATANVAVGPRQTPVLGTVTLT